MRTETLSDYVSLAKPRTVLLHVLTAATAMFLATKSLPPMNRFLFTLLGGGLVAIASNAFNCYFDRDIDRKMTRTRNRPLAAGRLQPRQALVFAVITTVIGLFILGRMVGTTTALLAAVALVDYVVIYTVWLKRRTSWSAVFGVGAGAMSPLIGWIAVTGRISIVPFLLFGIIALWTLPHFWSLTMFQGSDYNKAGIKIPKTKEASVFIIIGAILLVFVSLILVPISDLGNIFLFAALILGTGMLYLSLNLQFGKFNRSSYRYLYLYSIFYLITLFAAMVVDRIIMHFA